MKQAKSCKNAVSEASKSDSFLAAIQIDFSEKYKCLSQNQTQAAHFGIKPVTIFTCTIYHRGLEQKAFVSDFETQDKNFAINMIISKLPETVLRVEFYSDNAGSQFKNQFIGKFMKTFENMYKIKIRWNYFASMHGKSIVDVIGGSVKRFNDRRVKLD